MTEDQQYVKKMLEKAVNEGSETDFYKYIAQCQWSYHVSHITIECARRATKASVWEKSTFERMMVCGFRRMLKIHDHSWGFHSLGSLARYLIELQNEELFQAVIKAAHKSNIGDIVNSAIECANRALTAWGFERNTFENMMECCLQRMIQLGYSYMESNNVSELLSCFRVIEGYKLPFNRTGLLRYQNDENKLYVGYFLWKSRPEILYSTDFPNIKEFILDNPALFLDIARAEYVKNHLPLKSYFMLLDAAIENNKFDHNSLGDIHGTYLGALFQCWREARTHTTRAAIFLHPRMPIPKAANKDIRQLIAKMIFAAGPGGPDNLLRCMDPKHLDKQYSPDQILRIACEYGNVHFVRYYFTRVVSIVAENIFRETFVGQFETLVALCEKYSHLMSAEKYGKIFQPIFRRAAKDAFMENLRYIFSRFKGEIANRAALEHRFLVMSPSMEDALMYVKCEENIPHLAQFYLERLEQNNVNNRVHRYESQVLERLLAIRVGSAFYGEAENKLVWVMRVKVQRILQVRGLSAVHKSLLDNLNKDTTIAAMLKTLNIFIDSLPSQYLRSELEELVLTMKSWNRASAPPKEEVKSEIIEALAAKEIIDKEREHAKPSAPAVGPQQPLPFYAAVPPVEYPAVVPPQPGPAAVPRTVSPAHPAENQMAVEAAQLGVRQRQRDAARPSAVEPMSRRPESERIMQLQ